MISIILPIYNVQDYIAECLESVMNQTYKDIEIICVNDFTMDNSMTIVKNYAKDDHRIKIVNNERNRGLGGARNAGLDVAQGEYIIFCDTDDKMKPDMVEKLYDCIVKNDSDMVVCDIALLGNDGLQSPYKPFHDLTLINNRVFYPAKQPWAFCHMWPSAWNKVYKKSIIDENNIRYHENILYEDHTFYYEYLFASKKVSYLPEVLYVYRHERADSITKDVSPRIFEIFTILDYIKDIFKNNLSEEEYKILMPKIAVRLIWERYFVARKKRKIKSRFVKKSREYLKQFKQKDVFRYKDYFIGDSYAFLCAPLQFFMQKVISKRYYRDRKVMTIFGVKCLKWRHLRELYVQLDMMRQELNYLREQFSDEHK